MFNRGAFHKYEDASQHKQRPSGRGQERGRLVPAGEVNTVEEVSPSARYSHVEQAASFVDLGLSFSPKEWNSSVMKINHCDSIELAALGVVKGR